MIGLFFKNVGSALKGRHNWLKLNRKYCIKKNGIYVLVLPDDDVNYNKILLSHINDFCEYRKVKSVIILTTDNWVLENADKYSDKIIHIEKINQKVYKSYFLYHHFCVYEFSEQIIFMTLKGAYGKRIKEAEHFGVVNLEDMICLGQYLIRNWGTASG
jgi:hypothetical protein